MEEQKVFTLPKMPKIVIPFFWGIVVFGGSIATLGILYVVGLVIDGFDLPVVATLFQAPLIDSWFGLNQLIFQFFGEQSGIIYFGYCLLLFCGYLVLFYGIFIWVQKDEGRVHIIFFVCLTVILVYIGIKLMRPEFKDFLLTGIEVIQI